MVNEAKPPVNIVIVLTRVYNKEGGRGPFTIPPNTSCDVSHIYH